MPELSKREARKQNIKNTILQTAYRLFVENGYDNTTVGEILEEAGISRRTFFKYFPSKADLLHHYSQQMVKITCKKIIEYTNNRWSTKRRLTEYFMFSAVNVQKANDFAKTLLADAVSAIPALEKQWDPDQLEGIQSAFAELMRDGYEKGELDKSVPLEMHAQVVAGIYNGIVINWIFTPDYDLNKNMKQAAKLAVKAISA